MSERGHLRISWDYDSAFSRWIYENSINNDLLTKNKLIIVLYDNNKKINTFFGLDIYPLRRHQDNEVRLNTLHVPNDWTHRHHSVDESELRDQYDTVKKYLRTYGAGDYYYYDRVSVERISENILHFKFLRSKIIDSLKNPSQGVNFDYKTEHGSRVIRSSIYILNFSKFKNGHISFYLNSINENSHLFSRNFDELKSLPYIKFLNVSAIQKVSSDPEDCEYVWAKDSNCIVDQNSNPLEREIIRITKSSVNGGVPCNVGTYGLTRWVNCSNQDEDASPAPASAPAPSPASGGVRNKLTDFDKIAEDNRTTRCRIGCQIYNGDYWCASKDDPNVNDCDKFVQ